MKDLKFIGSSLDDLKNFPAEAKRDAGFQLHYIQSGQEPFDWKPFDWKTMKSVGSGAFEVRIHREGEWRIIYVAKFSDAVYVLHAFEKKTRKTQHLILNLLEQDTKRLKTMKNSKKQKNNNIFIDLGFEPAEAAVLEMRATLMSDLRSYIEREKLSQTDAAERLGISQSRVSDLVRGKWEKFSLEMLITLESRVGRTVKMELAA